MFLVAVVERLYSHAFIPAVGAVLEQIRHQA